MAFSLIHDFVGASQIGNVDSVQRHVLGLRVTAQDPIYSIGEFIYMPGVANCIAGSLAALDLNANTTTLTVAATRGPVGVATAAIVAGTWGWFQIEGACPVACNGAVVAQAPVFSTATAGKVDDAVVAGSKADGMVFKTADGTPAANFAIVELHFPSMNGNG